MSRTRACVIDDLRSANTSAAFATTTRPTDDEPVPAMPAAVRTILLQEEFEVFDPDAADVMRGYVRELQYGFQGFPHGRDIFAEHLKGTWGILHSWGQPQDVTRAGLFHTNYGGDLFIFAAQDPFVTSSREKLREVVGEEAEALTWTFGSHARGLVNSSLFAARANATLDPDGMRLASITGDSHHLTARMIAKVMIVTIADYLDQLVEINLWRDFNQHAVPKVIYPGSMKPEICFYWLSRVCKGIRDHLDVVPPIFEDCTAEIGYEDERRARDLYWEATRDEEEFTAAREPKLQEAAALNRFVAEPHVYLAELQLRDGRWRACIASARKAIENFYMLGAQWDKRLPYRQWVHLSRSLLTRCTRSSEGNTSLPMTAQGMILTSALQEEMERVSPGFLVAAPVSSLS